MPSTDLQAPVTVPAASSAPPRVRSATAEDLPRIAALAAEHAAFERAAAPAPDLAARLAAVLARPGGRPLRLFVAEAGAGEVVGYASCTPEFSTWEGCEYLHMDCLYLQEDHRGRGLGALLLQEVADEARRLGLARVEWQTPQWNRDAARFYDRRGATARPKLRYALPAGGAPSAGPA